LASAIIARNLAFANEESIKSICENTQMENTENSNQNESIKRGFAENGLG
jgi:hypothetical protein